MMIIAWIALVFWIGYLFLKYSNKSSKTDIENISAALNKTTGGKLIELKAVSSNDKIFYISSAIIIGLLISVIGGIYWFGYKSSFDNRGGYSFRTYPNFFDFLKINMLSSINQIDISMPVVGKIFPSPTLIPTPTPSYKTVVLQPVSNVGYQFYLAQIDYPNTPPLGDDVKNGITQVIYKAQFPKRLLANVGIVVINTLAITPGEMIRSPNGFDEMPIPQIPPVFLTGGGLFSQTWGPFNMIYINSKYVGSIDFLSYALTHELGHEIGSQMTDAEWAQYYQLRNIPTNTPKEVSSSWYLSPGEDFAEVYKNIFTGLDIQTAFGYFAKKSDYGDAQKCSDLQTNLINSYKSHHPDLDCSKYLTDTNGFDKYMECSKNIDKNIANEQSFEKSLDNNPQIQECRKNDFLQYEQTPRNNDSFTFPTQYYYPVVSQSAKDFVMGIVNRLNK